jgi:hypothetical protein
MAGEGSVSFGAAIAGVDSEGARSEAFKLETDSTSILAPRPVLLAPRSPACSGGVNHIKRRMGKHSIPRRSLVGISYEGKPAPLLSPPLPVRERQVAIESTTTTRNSREKIWSGKSNHAWAKHPPRESPATP